MRWQRGSSSVALAAYDYEIRHLVERYRTGTDFFLRNRGRAAIRSVEIEAESRPLQSIVVRAGVAVARGEALDDGTALDDVAAPNAVLEGRHAGAGWHIAEQLEIRCLVRNVTDRLFAGSADANASLAPGRSIMLGLNGRL